MTRDASESAWLILKGRLMKKAASMPKTNVETTFDEAVDYYIQNDGTGWLDFISTVSDGFKRLARREYVYRTHLRETFIELTAIKKRLKKLERYAAAVEGFESPDYMEVEDVQAVKDCVYIIRDVDVSGFYKIGVASDLKRRLAQLTICPFRIKIVHVIPTENAYSLEYQLHAQFADKRVRGEWFNLTTEDIAWLTAIGKA